MDVNTIRSKFPALGRGPVFFDNAGGSQVLGTVVDSIRDYLVNSNVQLGATYAVGKQASSSYENAYQAAAKYINASRDEIVLGASTTQLFRNLAATLTFAPGDELVLSRLDHEANIAPWVDLAARQQLTIRWWPPAAAATATAAATGPAPRLRADAALDALLRPGRTRLVACTHASNVLGTVHDLAAIAAAVRRRAPGALVCADAVAFAPHRRVDVRALAVDVYAFSWRKLHGPHLAVLYARAATALPRLRSLGPFFHAHGTLEQKLGLAGASYELMSAIPAVTEYMQGVGWDKIMAQEEELQGLLLGYLNGNADVTVYGERSADGRVRLPTVAFTVKGWDSQELVEAVEKDSPFAFRWGAFYSNRLVHELLGLDKSGVVRVSLVHYNTVEEVKAFVAALDKTLSQKK